MSWQDRTPQERRDLRERRTRRRDRKSANQAANRASKRIRGPVDEASVAWDEVRRQINLIRSGVERDAEWTRLARLLNGFIGDGRSPSHAHSQGVGGQ